MQYTPYVLPFFLSAIITLGLFFYVWYQHEQGNIVRGAISFALLMLAITGWSLCHSFEILSIGLETKIFWSRTNYLFIVSVPVTLWAFSAQYSGNERWIGPRNMILLSIIPAITVVMAFLNPYGFFWKSVSLVSMDLSAEHGVAFWLHATYSYTLVMVSLAHLIRTMFESASQYRWQIGLFTLGVLAPAILNVIYLVAIVTGFQFWPGWQDLTPIGFTISGLFLAWDLYRFGLLEIAPVARNVVIENMNGAMLVIDNHHRIIDVNPAAKQLIGLSNTEIIGKETTQILSTWPNMLERYWTVDNAQVEIIIPVGNEQRNFDLHITPLTDNKGHATGRLILLHDITYRKHIEGELQAAKLMAEVEREKSENLLLNILPRDIAALLKRGDSVIAQHFDSASILFADVVNFTPMAAQLSPDDVVTLLNELFSHFDILVERYRLEKIKTIGDCYMVAAGVPNVRNDHAQALVHLALEIQQYMACTQFSGKSLQFRIGINSGPVVAGVIGRKKFIYDLWGDTVNTASRMESHGMAGCVQITEATHQLVKNDFECESRGVLNIKGKGEMPVWYVKAVRQ